MTASRNRFSLTLPLSDTMDTRNANTPPSPSHNSSSSHSTPTKKPSAVEAPTSRSPLLTPHSCFEDDPEVTVEQSSFFDRARQLTRVFTKSPKHDTTSCIPTTSDQGIDYIRFHSLHTSSATDVESVKPPLGLPSPLTSTFNTSSRPTTASSYNSISRTASKRSLSNIAVDDSHIESPSQQSFKVARHFNENIPPELGGISSSKPVTTSRSKKSRRRKSLLDLASITGSSLSKATSVDLPSHPEGNEDPTIKRSRSLWNHPRHVSHDSFDSSSAAFQARYRQNFGSESPLGKQAMSARQRALNVKRARKMAQVFGDEPPPELYQIADRDDDDELGDNRDSIITSYSLSSTYLLSFNAQKEAGEEESVPPVVIEPPKPRRPRPECDEFVDKHPTPPPFSSLVEQHHIARRISSAPPDRDSNSTDFQERRKRAAKLSRFFGVGYHEFTRALAVLPPPPLPANDQLNPSSVEIFWETGHDKVKQADISDVIGKLRELR